jgi:hypothetical protein
MASVLVYPITSPVSISSISWSVIIS